MAKDGDWEPNQQLDSIYTVDFLKFPINNFHHLNIREVIDPWKTNNRKPENGCQDEFTWTILDITQDYKNKESMSNSDCI